MSDKITYDDKVGVKPKTVQINQVWDDDMNEIKNKHNAIDDRVIAIESSGVVGVTPIDVSAEWTSGLSFNVSADNYPVLGTFYSSTPGVVVLDTADATLDRIDLIVAIAPVFPATVGTVGKITGTPATTALVVAPDYDPSLYYVIRRPIVRAAATTPEDTSTELVYDENLGTPTEWDFVSSSITIDDSTNDAFSGTHSIEATNPLQGDKSIFARLSIESTSNINLLTFYIKLKADFEGSYIYIKFFNGITQVGDTYTFNNGENGFDSSSLVWQKITIDSSKLNLPIAQYDIIEIYPYKSFSGYFMDLIQTHKGSGSEVPLIFVQEASIGTGTILDLTNLNGTLYNMSSASPSTTYTTIGSTLNAYARALINAASIPIVSSATKIKGSEFIMNTDMYLTAWYNGNVIEYWFEEI